MTLRLAIGFLAIAAVAVPALGQDDLTVLPPAQNGYQPKTTEWGEPDFRGGWPIDHLNGRTPLMRDPQYGNRIFLTEEEFAERAEQVEVLAKRYESEDESGTMGIGHWAEVAAANRRTSWITSPANGRLPDYTPEGKRMSDAMRSTWRRGQDWDWTTDFDSWDRCITRGLPASMFPVMYNNGIRVFQSPGIVAIQFEMVHETRIIPTDGRPGIPRQVDMWMGESRGRWDDGNTLVVETTNFKPGPSITNIGTTGSPPENDTPLSPSARMVERFTMTGPDTIVYDFTWEDPVVFTAPWSGRLDWVRDDDFDIFEYACHEGNEQIRNYINTTRHDRAQKRESSQ